MKVVLNINTVTLVAPVKEMLEDSRLKPKSSKTNKGTAFVFEASAAIQHTLLNSLANLLKAKGPVDLNISVE